MNELLKFISRNQNSTNVQAPVAKGLKVVNVASASHCQCDCYECAGGNTSED